MLCSAHLPCQLIGPLLLNKQCDPAAATNNIACVHMSEAQGAGVCVNMLRPVLSLAIGIAHKSR